MFYSSSAWPTEEMLSRGRPRCLLIGLLVAVPSGAGIALSVLSGNAGSLVGVAISASLLPPAVNCGLFWAVAFVIGVSGKQEYLFGFQNATYYYEPCYVDDPALESFLLGAVSLALTALNIVSIIATGVAILRLKEVTPDKIPQSFSTFWRRDVRAHRDYYRTLHHRAGGDLDLVHETREALGICSGEDPDGGLADTFLQRLFEEACADCHVMDIRNWVASPPSSTTAKRRVLRGQISVMDQRASSNVARLAECEHGRRRTKTVSASKMI